MNHYEQKIVNLALNAARVRTIGSYIDYEHKVEGCLAPIMRTNDKDRMEKLFNMQLMDAAEFLLMHRSDIRVEDYVGGGLGI